MSLQEAVDILNDDDDDLPDGAFWAMAHDMAGVEYGTAQGELDAARTRPIPRAKPVDMQLPCSVCHRKFVNEDARRQHTASVHGGDKYAIPCKTCTRTFRKDAHLLQHMADAHKKQLKKQLQEQQP